MKGAANFSNTGDIDLAAFKAGNDVMLMSEDVEIGVDKIMDALIMGRLQKSVWRIR